MEVLVIGSGGREHALAWKLSQSPRVSRVYCAPGNAGTASCATNVPIPATDIIALRDFASEAGVELTVVGPDDVLAAGLVDEFQSARLRAFGPIQAAARLESSKSFAKDFMRRHGIPTAEGQTFSAPEAAHAYVDSLDRPVAVKADGLALGKGVKLAHTQDEAHAAIREIMEDRAYGAAGDLLVIEELLEGVECSIHALVDGSNYCLFPSVKDHKQAEDGDRGPNTGGMGACSPNPLLTPELMERVRAELLDPFLRGIQADGLPFRGMLFPGLMLLPDGRFKVLEFNCRFGDPEAQALLPRLKSDLLELLEATLDGRLDSVTPQWDERAAVCVVMASGGYPGSYEKGKVITGLHEAERLEEIAAIFHAGTHLPEERGDDTVTAGGRVLGVTALSADLATARQRAYAAVKAIHFDKAYYRTDIGQSILS